MASNTHDAVNAGPVGPAAASIRELGLKVGMLPTGPRDHILDVAGLGLAHRSYRDAKTGVCTGFTVLHPSAVVNQRFPAAIHALNGAGELTASHQIAEWGLLDSPILLTNTPSVGRGYDAVTSWMMIRDPSIGSTNSVVIPVVGECDDSVLHDPRQKAWGENDVFAALDDAFEIASGKRAADAAALAQGDVGGGSGMITFELKAGIGSASRRVTVRGREYTVGVLLQTNFGRRAQLTVLGRSLGSSLAQPLPKEHREGSCIGILATDAPLDSLGLKRLATRLGLGLARTGSHAHHGSGEIFLAFSTHRGAVNCLEWQSDDWNPLLIAAVEGAEEAVYNSLLCAHDVETARGAAWALKPENVIKHK